MAESFVDLFEEYLEQIEIKKDALITGEVIAIDSEMVTINVGLKSEGIVPRNQFTDANGALEVAVGDQVLVALQEIEDGLGATQISRERAKQLERWQVLETHYQQQTHVTGVITASIKGGFQVDLNGVQAFLPGSLIDVRPLQETSHLEGIDLQFLLIKLDEHRNNVVVSRRAVLEKTNKVQREEVLASLTEGAQVTGFVKNITDYGAFIDLGGVDGLLHITDIAWRRIKHPSEILTVGQKIEVKVLKFDEQKQRVSLGYKQLQQDPWTAFVNDNPVGSRLPATVTTITDYGCFARVSDGIEGLVHSSEMSWVRRNLHPSKLVKVGAEVEVMLLDVNQSKRRLSLGMKQCQQNPWVNFSSQFAVGEKVTGKLNSKTDFGLFVSLADGVDGLVHISDIAWHRSDESLLVDYHKGDDVEALILSIDTERERIALGVKQLHSDPFNDYIQANAKGTQVTGTVTEIASGGLFIALATDVIAFLKRSELSEEKSLNDYKEGEEISAFIGQVDKKGRSIQLSIRTNEEASNREKMQQLRTQPVAVDGPTTIGDLIKEQLDK